MSALAKPNRRAKRSALNSPVVLILVLLGFGAVAAQSFGLFDTLFNPAPEPPVRHQTVKTQTPSGTSQNASSPAAPLSAGDTGAKGNPAHATAGSNSAPVATGDKAKTGATGAGPAAGTTIPGQQPTGGTTPDQKTAAQVTSAGITGGNTQPGKTPAPDQAQTPVAATASETANVKLTVPDFIFPVGRDNPFKPIPGMEGKSRPATTGVSSSPVPKTNVPVTGTGSRTATVDPKEPWQSWRFTGISTHGTSSFGIVETPTNSYIVKVGDRIEGVWRVESITATRMVLVGLNQTISLMLGGDPK